MVIKNIALGCTALIILLILYLLLWPVPVDPIAWMPPEPPPMTGVYEPNTRLKAVELVAEGHCDMPEDIAVDGQGKIYSGMIQQGRIMRFQPDGSQPEIFADTGGGPAGMTFDADGNLLVADSIRGLLSIAPDGSVTVLTDEVDGRKLKMINDVDVAADGTVYFSESSSKFGAEEILFDIVEHRPHGRLLAYDPTARTTRVVLEGLYFANGVAVSPDSSFVLVVESNVYRVTRYWLRGPHNGRSEVFIDNLPGFPDNIDSDGEDTFWLALVFGPEFRRFRDPLMPHPFLGKVFARLPRSITESPARPGYGFVLGLDSNGRIIHNLQDPEGERYHTISSATEHNGMLYLGTICPLLRAIGRIPVP